MYIYRYILKSSHSLYERHTKNHLNFKPTCHGYIVQNLAKNGREERIKQTLWHGKL